MCQLSTIKHPVEQELELFNTLFDEALATDEELLIDVLLHIRQRMGKRMRPILVLLIAKAFGHVSMVTQNAAIGLELLHTASLVHDDVVDESSMRRGQASVNAIYDNQVSVLVGDFILATALLKISHTRNHRIIDSLAELGRCLASGELLQLSNINRREISEALYYDIIDKKTATMFETCAELGALSVDATDDLVDECKLFGKHLGIAFQIRDDIFDYFSDHDIGKPTGNDMLEGKLTLPAIYALNTTQNLEYVALAMKVKERTASGEDIARLVKFTKENGGIEYAERRIAEYKAKAMEFVDHQVKSPEIHTALSAYVDYAVGRKI